MPISLYSGLPRSGKSFSVVEHVLIPAAKEKRQIYTNIPLDLDLFEAEFGIRPVQFTADDIEKNPAWFDDVLPHGALLALDECWRVWPAGLKLNNAIPAHKAFLAEHGHRVGEDGRSTEIVLVTQDAAQLAAFVRLLVATTYRTKKLDVLGQAKKFRIDVYEGCMAGANPPAAKRVREMYGTYKPEIYRFYKSHTQSKTGSAGNEERADKRANLLKGGSVKAMLAALVILPVLVYFGARNTYQKFHPKEETKVAQAAPVIGHARSIPVKQRNKFFDGKDFAIISNISTGDAIYYQIEVRGNGGRVVLDINDLARLGVRLDSINDCLVKLVGDGLSEYVMCSDPQYRSTIAAVGDGVTGKDSTAAM